MRGFFSPDNPVMAVITKLSLTVWLNILWIVFSLPLFTIGASTTALFTVTLKMAGDQEGYVTDQFISAFRKNFRFSTKVWGILAGGIVILAADGYILYHLKYTSVFWTLITAVYLAALIVFAIVLMYIFPLMAYFENTVSAMLRNSLMVGVRYLFCTILMAGIYFAMLVVIVRFFTPAVLFGEGLCAYLCSRLLRGVFTRLSGSEEEKP